MLPQISKAAFSTNGFQIAITKIFFISASIDAVKNKTGIKKPNNVGSYFEHALLGFYYY